MWGDRNVPEREQMNIEIEITVQAPHELALQLNNNYGVTEIDSWRENMEVNSNYAQVYLNDIAAERLDPVSSYSDVNLQSVDTSLSQKIFRN